MKETLMSRLTMIKKEPKRLIIPLIILFIIMAFTSDDMAEAFCIIIGLAIDVVIFGLLIGLFIAAILFVIKHTL